MRVWNVLRNDFARTVCSKAFVFAALGLTAATFLTGMEELSCMQSENDLIYIYGIFQYLDFQLLFLLFAAIPGAALFCADWENRFIRFSAQRCSKRIYGVSKRHCVLCLGGAGGRRFRVARPDDLTALGLSGGEHGKRNPHGAGRV